MRYRLIKKVLNALYCRLYNTHVEICTDKLYRELNNLGRDSWIDYPFEIPMPGNVSIGDNTKILQNSRLDCYSNGDKTGNISFGNGCYVGYRFSILAGEDVSIGNDVLIASGVTICSENHGINPSLPVAYMHQPLLCKKVSIGDGTWIGENVIILPGVSIGKKCVIGGGAVVTKNVPDYSIAVGNPAVVKKTYNMAESVWEVNVKN